MASSTSRDLRGGAPSAASLYLAWDMRVRAHVLVRTTPDYLWLPSPEGADLRRQAAVVRASRSALRGNRGPGRPTVAISVGLGD